MAGIGKKVVSDSGETYSILIASKQMNVVTKRDNHRIICDTKNINAFLDIGTRNINAILVESLKCHMHGLPATLISYTKHRDRESDTHRQSKQIDTSKYIKIPLDTFTEYMKHI